MRCGEALEQMLVAEPSELRGREHSELARHVAGCSRCGKVAARIVGDTALLASAISSLAIDERRRSTGVRVLLGSLLSAPRWRVLQLGLAASALALVLPPIAERAPTGFVATSATAVVGRSAPPPASPAALRATGTTAAPTPDLGRDISKDHKPYEPVRFEAVPQRVVVDESSGPAAGDRVSAADPSGALPREHVTVVPEIGERALVARTSDPRITVVWLYR